MYKFVNPVKVLGKKEGYLLWMCAIISGISTVGGVFYGFVHQEAVLCAVSFISALIWQSLAYPLILKAQDKITRGQF